MIDEGAPLVTAVIPVYNHERYVVESIRSIVDQTYRNIELIVINDGSKDASHEQVLSLVELCKQRFVRFEYINRSNLGLSSTLNQALEMAKGNYFSVMASDDVALPEKIQTLASALEAKGPEYAAAFGNAWFIDSDSCRIWLTRDGAVSRAETNSVYDNYLDFRTEGRRVADYKGNEFGAFASLLAYNYLPAMSNLVKTEAIRQAGAWTNGNASEDWEMWRKLSKQYRFLYIDEPLALYRWHESNAVKTDSARLKLCSLRLLMNEEQYCAQNSLTPLWKKAYVSLLLPVLTDTRIALKEKTLVVKRSESLYIASEAGKRLARRAFRRFR